MKYISHRGNISGKNVKRENHPLYIMEAIALAFDVEIDVWMKDGMYYTGHDNPQYAINLSFLENDKLWCHAKNIECFHEMLKNKKIHCFWHQEDFCTLTSRGFVWTYPGQDLFDNSICVLPEASKYEKISCYGMCSDYICEYREGLR